MEFFLLYTGIALVTTLCIVIIALAISAAYSNVEKVRAAAEFAFSMNDERPSSASWHPSENI